MKSKIVLLGFLPSLFSGLAAAPPERSEPLRQLVFVSCFKESLPAPALDTIAAMRSDVFLWMGDNIYGDTRDPAILRAKYQFVRELPSYADIRSRSRVIGTWDDHDYGKNDAGKEFPIKAASQQALLDFLDTPASSPRRKQQGVYWMEDFGPHGRSVRVIMLDTRYFRDAIGSDGTLLGETQWSWLESALTTSTARVNVLVSSIQVLASEHRFEKWANFPKERKRLLQLLARADVPPVFILSGDRHVAEISVDRESCGYPLHDITSSSLNLPLGEGDEPNRYREGVMFRPANFGTLNFDWSHPDPVVTACIHDSMGLPQRSVTLQLRR